MHPVLLNVKLPLVGTIIIPSYHFMIALGFIIAGWLAIKRADRSGIDRNHVIDLIICCMISGILGARIFYYIQYYDKYFADKPFYHIFMFWEGGMTFYGAPILAFICAVLMAFIKKWDIWALMDILAVSTPLGMSLGRIGCYLGGCCWGKQTDLPWGVIFPGHENFILHPSQLYSSLNALLLYIFLSYFYEHRKNKGECLLMFFMLYSVSRFLIEFLRADEAPFFAGLTISQTVCLIIFPIAFIIFILVRASGERRGNLPAK